MTVRWLVKNGRGVVFFATIVGIFASRVVWRKNEQGLCLGKTKVLELHFHCHLLIVWVRSAWNCCRYNFATILSFGSRLSLGVNSAWFSINKNKLEQKYLTTGFQNGTFFNGILKLCVNESHSSRKKWNTGSNPWQQLTREKLIKKTIKQKKRCLR